MIIQGDCLEVLKGMEAESVHCCVTSPPYYGLRDYGVDGQLGLEPTLEEYLEKMVAVFREVKRVLRKDGTCFCNIGDAYAHSSSGGGGAVDVRKDGRKTTPGDKVRGRIGESNSMQDGLKPKDMLLIPQRLALALQADGWWIRSEIIWHKNNPMPESVQGSHISRHRVTIEEYERLSSLWKEQRGNQDGSSNLSDLPEGEVSCCQASLPEKREGPSNGKGKGRTRRREGKAETTQPILAREIKQSEIRGNGKGQDNQAKSYSQIQNEREIPSEKSRILSENQEPSFSNSNIATSQRALWSFRENEGEETAGLCSKESGNSARSTSNSRGLVGDSETSQEPMLLLWQEESINIGSRDTVEQGWQAREGEYSSGLSELQLEEEGQDNSTLLVDCPGCPKCDPYGGYIPHLSAGRPTKSHEQIWLLTKSGEYFFDSEAVKEKYTEPLNRWGGDSLKRDTSKTAEYKDMQKIGNSSAMRVGGPIRPHENGRNIRDVWTMSTESYSGNHFATFPQELVLRCLKAATSERGCCPKCGKMWRREVEDTPEYTAIKKTQNWKENRGETILTGNEYGHSKTAGVTKSQVTLGFRPGCACDLPPIPATVLDPFAGSGTTLLVAKRMGLSAIGLDLSYQYLRENAWERVGMNAPVMKGI